MIVYIFCEQLVCNILNVCDTRSQIIADRVTIRSPRGCILVVHISSIWEVETVWLFELFRLWHDSVCKLNVY